MGRKALIAAVLFSIGIAGVQGQQGREFQAVRQNNVTLIQAVAPDALRLRRNFLAVAKKRVRALELRARLAQRRIDLGAIDRSRVPVLINRRDDMLGNMQVFVGQDHYTASTKLGNAVVQIDGTRVATEAPRDFRMPRVIKRIRLQNAQPPAPFQRFGRHPQQQQQAATAPGADEDALEDVNIEHTASGVDITFTRLGHTYNITMDCGDQAKDPEAIGAAQGEPAGDASCTDQNALDLAQDLEVAGGGEDGP